MAVTDDDESNRSQIIWRHARRLHIILLILPVPSSECRAELTS